MKEQRTETPTRSSWQDPGALRRVLQPLLVSLHGHSSPHAVLRDPSPLQQLIHHHAGQAFPSKGQDGWERPDIPRPGWCFPSARPWQSHGSVLLLASGRKQTAARTLWLLLRARLPAPPCQSSSGGAPGLCGSQWHPLAEGHPQPAPAPVPNTSDPRAPAGWATRLGQAPTQLL